MAESYASPCQAGHCAGHGASSQTEPCPRLQQRAQGGLLFDGLWAVLKAVGGALPVLHDWYRKSSCQYVLKVASPKRRLQSPNPFGEEEAGGQQSEQRPERSSEGQSGNDLLSVLLMFRVTTSTPQLPLKEPQIPSNRDHNALNRGTLGGLGRSVNIAAKGSLGCYTSGLDNWLYAAKPE